VLERPNCHTRYAYESVQRECERLGVELPGRHEHAYNATYLRKEEEEYRLADLLLCPSDFVAQTFVDEGFAPDKLARHMYGYDPANFYPRSAPRAPGGLRALFVGVAAVRKGVHFALEAWLASPASASGTFRIAGEFLPAYSRRLESMLAHPSVEVLGHRNDVAELMRESDVLVLPSIEEGSALVVGEALASGAVPLVSEATSGVTLHDVNSLVHGVGDVPELTRHLSALSASPELLEKLRLGALRTAPDYTWDQAGLRLADVYRAAAAADAKAAVVPARLTA
jgi:glycosyltransferase involved in cell wall biosynthesis